MNGKALKATLATVEEGSIQNSLWEVLPDMVSGSNWQKEIADTARSMADYLNDDDEYSLDALNDLAHQWADGEVEDYYTNINRRVQDLSLWAFDDLDQEVQEMNSNATGLTINNLNMIYLFCALRGLFQAVAEWAITESEGE